MHEFVFLLFPLCVNSCCHLRTWFFYNQGGGDVQVSTRIRRCCFFPERSYPGLHEFMGVHGFPISARWNCQAGKKEQKYVQNRENKKVSMMNPFHEWQLIEVDYRYQHYSFVNIWRLPIISSMFRTKIREPIPNYPFAKWKFVPNMSVLQLIQR